MEKRSEFRPHIIRAGAGTGKTFALIEKVFRLIDEFERLNGRKPRLIVSTFTRKAAAELSERLSQKAVSRSFDLARCIHSSDLFVGTLHGLFSSFLKTCGCQIAVPSDFEMISSEEEREETSADIFRFVHEKRPSLLHRMPFKHLDHCLQFYCRERMRRGGRPLDFYNEKDFEEFQALFEKEQEQEQEKLDSRKRKQCQEGLIAGDFLPVFKEFQQAAEAFFPEFEEKKKRSGRFTPDDFEGLLQNVFREKKGSVRRLTDEWDYWLIDEYQDTSRIQEEMLETLTQFKNVFCVGDPGQSVYLFRGADPAVFDRRVTAFKKACGEEPEELTVNRRSRPSLIAFFNELFAEKESGFLRLRAADKTAAVAEGKESSAGGFLGRNDKGASSPSVLSDSPSAGSETREELAAKPPVYLIPFPSAKKQKDDNDADSREERAFEALYRHIQKLSLRPGRDAEEDIAVLSNKNETLTELSLFLEKKKQLSAVFAGKGRFIKNRAVLDALFLFKFLANPFDDQNLISLLQTDLFKISDETLTAFYRGYKKRRAPASAAAALPPPGGNGAASEKSFWDYILKYFREEGAESAAAPCGGAQAGDIESEMKAMTDVLRSCQAFKNRWGLIPAFEKALKNLFLDSASAADSKEAVAKDFLAKRDEIRQPTRKKPPQGARLNAQDRAALWKMLQCLHGRRKKRENPLNFYYDFLHTRLSEEENKEPIVEKLSRPVRLLTVHGAKGLEFDHVIILNLSRQKSTFKEEMIFDEERGKSAFSVPLETEGRRGSKKKSYGHQQFNKKRNNQEKEESDRQLYTAVTRAKKSLAFLVPDEWKNPPPWFKRFRFFEETFYNKEGKLAEGFFEREGWSYQAGEPLATGSPPFLAKPPLLREPETPEEPLTASPFSSSSSSSSADIASDSTALSASCRPSGKEQSGLSKKISPAEKSPAEKSPAEKSPAEKSPAEKSPVGAIAGAARAADACSRAVSAGFFRESNESEAEKRFLSSTDFIAFSEKQLESGESSDSYSDSKMKENVSYASFSGDKENAGGKKALNISSDEAEGESLQTPPLASAAVAVNVFIKAQSGLELHHYLRLLAVHPADRVQKTLQSSSASADSKGALKKALDYVLKDPDLSFFIQNGFAEQEFKLKEGDFILQGRIDLWGWRGKTIFLFDYKSGGAPRNGAAIDRAGSDLLEAGLSETGLPESDLPEASEGRAGLSGAPSSVAGFRQSADRFAFAAEKQLAFYSFVLNRLFRPEAVRAFLVFPFQETMKERPFSMEKTEREIALFLKKPSYTGLY